MQKERQAMSEGREQEVKAGKKNNGAAVLGSRKTACR